MRETRRQRRSTTRLFRSRIIFFRRNCKNYKKLQSRASERGVQGFVPFSPFSEHYLFAVCAHVVEIGWRNVLQAAEEKDSVSFHLPINLFPVDATSIWCRRTLHSLRSMLRWCLRRPLPSHTKLKHTRAKTFSPRHRRKELIKRVASTFTLAITLSRLCKQHEKNQHNKCESFSLTLSGQASTNIQRHWNGLIKNFFTLPKSLSHSNLERKKRRERDELMKVSYWFYYKTITMMEMSRRHQSFAPFRPSSSRHAEMRSFLRYPRQEKSIRGEKNSIANWVFSRRKSYFLRSKLRVLYVVMTFGIYIGCFLPDKNVSNAELNGILIYFWWF